MRQVRTLGLLGTGVIGGGWAARALHFGIDVLAADLKPEMQEWIRGAVANAEAALARLTLAPLPPQGKLSFTTDLQAMARQADLDRKSTRLNSSHLVISYAVFCLKKKKKNKKRWTAS